VRGAVATMALEQSGGGIQQEREHQALRLGLIEGAFEGTPRGDRVAEGVAGHRVEQESLNHPKVGVRQRNGAVDDGRQRGNRRFRIVPGEPQRRHRDANLSVFALRPLHLGEGLLDAPRITHPHERLQ
jgi:hypothetical protein